MTRLLHAETLKVLTIRTFLWIALANLALVLVSVIAILASVGEVVRDDEHRATAHIAGTALVLALISGIVVMGGEARYGTITQALLVTPMRERVLLAKVVVASLVGLVLAALSEALVVAATLPDFLDVRKAGGALIGVLIAAPLAGALGAGLAALVHAQGQAIGISLAWLLIGENLAPVVSDSATKYTPGRSFGALASGVLDGGGSLGMVGGGIAAAAWAAIFVAAGLLALLGRDV